MHPNDNTASVYLKTADLMQIIKEHGNSLEVLSLCVSLFCKFWGKIIEKKQGRYAILKYTCERLSFHKNSVSRGRKNGKESWNCC